MLAVTLTETLHGNTYINSDIAGANFLEAEGYTLQQVDRNNEPVTGGLSLLPGGQSLAFTPAVNMALMENSSLRWSTMAANYSIQVLPSAAYPPFNGWPERSIRPTISRSDGKFAGA